jgi:hypothetical protein
VDHATEVHNAVTLRPFNIVHFQWAFTSGSYGRPSDAMVAVAQPQLTSA